MFVAELKVDFILCWPHTLMIDLKLERILKIRCFLPQSRLFLVVSVREQVIFKWKARFILLPFYKFSKGRKSLPESSSGWFPFTGIRDVIWWFVLKLNPNISSLPVQALLWINFTKQIKMWTTWNIFKSLACDTHCVSQDMVFVISDFLNCWRCESAVEGKLPNNVKHQEN